MKVLIVGGVAGGAGAAARLRRNDEKAEIILFEKGEYISFANCGLPYYIGGTITERAKLQVQTPQAFRARFNVDVRVQHEVTGVDSAAKTVTVKNHATGETYTESYDSLVLSPGASPIRPKMPGMEENHIFTLRNIPDTYAIYDHIQQAAPKTAAVIGAGFIGLEMAENLADRGLAVSVVEAAPHVMAPLDMDMAHTVHNYIRGKGLGLYVGKKCSGFTKDSVLLDDGTAVPADMVILSIGVAPETRFLEGSGVELGGRGEILVNEELRTSVPDIYALGDAATVKNIVTGKVQVIPLAGPANKQARIVADVICGKKARYKGSQGTSVMKFFDQVVACTGEKEESLKAAGIPFHKTFTISASHAGYYPGSSQMIVKLLYTPDEGKVLGAQIVGGDGVDKRIDHLANAVRFGLTVYDLQEMELAYAPPFSSAKDPVNMAGFVAQNVLEGTMTPFYAEDVENLPENAVCIDVRAPRELEALGTVPGFVNIPVDQLRQRLDEIDLSKPLYITCQVGLRGYVAQRILAQSGANEVHNLSGGYTLYSAYRKDLAGMADAEKKSCASCGKQE